MTIYHQALIPPRNGFVILPEHFTHPYIREKPKIYIRLGSAVLILVCSILSTTHDNVKFLLTFVSSYGSILVYIFYLFMLIRYYSFILYVIYDNPMQEC